MPNEIILENKLKEIRMREFMMNQKEFSEHIEVNPSQYLRYEKSTASPSLEVALWIAQKLKRSLHDIWTIKEKQDL